MVEPGALEAADRGVTAAQARGFLVALVSMGVLAYDVGFDLAVYGDFFFHTYMGIWATSTLVLFGAAFLPRDQRPFGRGGILVLLSPSLYWPGAMAETWLMSQPAEAIDALPGSTRIGIVLLYLSAAIAYVVAVPYALVVLARILDPERVAMPNRRLSIALVAGVVAFAAIGMFAGRHHSSFLTCDRFELAGSMAPEGCTETRYVPPSAE